MLIKLNTSRSHAIISLCLCLPSFLKRLYYIRYYFFTSLGSPHCIYASQNSFPFIFPILRLCPACSCYVCGFCLLLSTDLVACGFTLKFVCLVICHRVSFSISVGLSIYCLSIFRSNPCARLSMVFSVSLFFFFAVYLSACLPSICLYLFVCLYVCVCVCVSLSLSLSLSLL